MMTPATKHVVGNHAAMMRAEIARGIDPLAECNRVARYALNVLGQSRDADKIDAADFLIRFACRVARNHGVAL